MTDNMTTLIQIGQAVYLVRRPFGHPAFVAQVIVEYVKIVWTKHGRVCQFGGYNFEVCDTDLGKKVFITKEEAEKALED